MLRVGQKLVLATVTSSGSIETPHLRVAFNSDHSLTDRDMTGASTIISSVFNVALDVTPFYSAIRDDRIMADVTQRLRSLRNAVTPTVFEALFDSIVEQQISLNVAHVLQRRVIKNFGDVLRVEAGHYYAFPMPESLAHASVDSLRRCGLSRRKAKYITDAAQRVVSGEVDLDGLRQCDDVQEILDYLCALRGVGVWTAELTAIRGLNKLDAMPADDLGLRRLIAHYYRNDRQISSAEARDIAEQWGKWKGLAGYYLVVAGLLGIPPKAE